jgi:precorrin-6A/cobalt-precorrin-6A reductase
MRVLILGGTREARELKEQLGDQAILALKRTTTFGGADGLRRYVDEHGITHVVDATHPFAARISQNAATTTVPLLRLERPPYTPRAGYVYIDHLRELELPETARVFLTTGHHEIEALEDHPAFFLVRAINPPPVLPRHHELILAQGPFTLENERELIRRHCLTHLISKDSGGPDAKIEAAAEAGLTTVLIRRPPLPPAAHTVATVQEVLAYLSVMK